MPRSTLLRKLRVTPTRAASPASVSPRSGRNAWIRPPNSASRSIDTASFCRACFFMPLLCVRRPLSDHLAGQLLRIVATVVDHHLAVDHDVVDPRRPLGRLGIGRSVVDGRGVEDHKIGEGAFPDRAAFFEPKPSGWKRRDPSDGVLEREQLAIANEVTEHARHRAIAGRVRNALAGDDGVRLEGSVRVGHQFLQPRLVIQLTRDAEVEAHRVPAFLQGQVGGDVERIFAPFVGDRLQALALEVLVSLALHPLHPDVLPAGGFDQVVRPPTRRPAGPAGHILLDGSPDLLTRLRVTQALQQRIDAAGQRPGRIDREQGGVGGDVGDDVEAGVDATRPRLLVELDHLVEPRPVRPSERLDVRVLAGDAVLLPHPDHLARRRNQGLTRAAYVRGVDRVLGKGRGQLDNLLRRREDAGCIQQPGGKAEGAFLHRTPDQILHSLELFSRELTPLESHLVDADRAVGDHRDDVHRDTSLLQVFEELAEASPLPGQLFTLEEGGVALHLVERGGIDRSRRVAAVAGHDGCDPLLDEWGQHVGVALYREEEFRVGMDVDEPGRHHVPLRIDHLASLRLAIELAAGVDPVAGDTDFPGKPWVARPVGDPRVGDQAVEHQARLARGRRATSSQRPVSSSTATPVSSARNCVSSVVSGVSGRASAIRPRYEQRRPFKSMSTAWTWSISSGITISLPGRLSFGSPKRTSIPMLRAMVSCAVGCLPAPVYSVSWTTTSASLGSLRATDRAAAREVFPAGPRSSPSSSASSWVAKKTSPWVIVTYRSR